MLRAVFLLAALLTLPFVASVALVRSQPYDDGDLRAFLMPPDCPRPCFLGLRPGETRWQDALALLRASGLVTEFQTATSDPDWASIRWNDSASRFINAAGYGSIQARDDILTAVVVPSTVRMGDLLALLGEPDWGTGRFGTSGRRYLIGYANVSASFGFTGACPETMRRLLQRPVTLYIVSGTPSAVYDHPTVENILNCELLTSIG